MAYKELNECFKAIEDFNSALAHSRKSFSCLLDQAECLITVDQLDEATRALELYMLTKPGSARAYVLKGMIYEKEGFFSKAEDEYTRALHYDANYAPALDKRANVLVRSGKPRQAVEDLDALAAITPKQPEVFMNRARLFVKLKDYAAALRDYDYAESLAPRDRRIRKEKVLVYFKTYQPRKALDTLSRDPSSQGEDLDVQILHARAHILLQDYAEAEKILKQVMSKDARNGQAYLYSALIFKSRKLLDEALAYLNRATELEPSLVEAYKERARIFADLGESVRAAADLTTAGNLDPADGEIFALRGVTFVERGLCDAAIDDFTRALTSIPNDPRILFDRAVAYLHKDEAVYALADLDEVLRVTPRSARAWSLHGVANYMLGKADQAGKDLEEATTINPDDPQVWNNRGFFMYRTGNQKGAMDSLNRALQLSPQYKQARYNLGLVLKKEETLDAPSAGAPVTNPHSKE